MTTVGQLIRDRRGAAKLTQRELATQVGVSVPHISKIEADVETASDELLRRIAVALDTDPDEMLLTAQRVPDAVRQVTQDKQGLAVQFFRKWKSGEITDADVLRLVERDE